MAIQGPRRTTVQRQRTGPAPTIGAAPRSAAQPTSARYLGALGAKRVRDRATVARSRAGRKRGGAGAMQPRTRRDIINDRNARNGTNGTNGYNGNGVNGNGNGVNGNGMMITDWLMNPLVWAGALGIFFFMRGKGKKRG